ncbi:MAG TPA: amidohydrolase family protein [Steroidobacteraceae bacterium]
MTRRTLLMAGAALPLASGAVRFADANEASMRPMRRIAVEEHFTIPELTAAWRGVIQAGAADEPGFRLLVETVYSNPTPAMALINKRLADMGDDRIQYLDKMGIDLQVVMIAAPGVQVLQAAEAKNIARLANDRLAEMIGLHPQRFAGLATIAPQDPAAAAVELHRAVKTLGLRGAIIHSHTKGEYLDQEKFFPIFEAAAALQVPIYLHPREPSPDMLKAYLDYYLFFAGWGFAAETGLHAMRLIFSGLFDKLPTLQIVIGHLGEGIPYWLERVDYYQQFLIESGKQKQMRKPASAYFKDNFTVTTSGMNSPVAIDHALKVLGADRIMFAVDYPYTYGDKDVAVMNGSTIGHGAKQKIFQTNAERLFKL